MFAPLHPVLACAGHSGSPLDISSWWLAFTAFFGANLLQSGITRGCPRDLMLRKLGAPIWLLTRTSRPGRGAHQIGSAGGGHYDRAYSCRSAGQSMCS
jgi:hypothetical protein